MFSRTSIRSVVGKVEERVVKLYNIVCIRRENNMRFIILTTRVLEIIDNCLLMYAHARTVREVSFGVVLYYHVLLLLLLLFRVFRLSSGTIHNARIDDDNNIACIVTKSRALCHPPTTTTSRV